MGDFRSLHGLHLLSGDRAPESFQDSAGASIEVAPDDVSAEPVAACRLLEALPGKGRTEVTTRLREAKGGHDVILRFHVTTEENRSASRPAKRRDHGGDERMAARTINATDRRPVRPGLG